PNLSDSKSFTVVVTQSTPVNQPPVFNPIGPRTVDEGSALTLTATATDSDVPVQVLTFSLVSPPAGATITPSGAFSWTPNETQGPSSTIITVKVTDNGSPNLSATNNFTVTVNEVNSLPVLSAITNRTVVEGQVLTFTNTASDPDLPANRLTF